MKEKIKILHLEDLASDVEMVERVLKKGDILYEKIVVDAKKEFEQALKTFQPHVILSDHSLPAFNSIDALTITRNNNPSIPFILVTGTTSEEFAVDVMKRGADDYILKDRLQRLPAAIMNLIEKRRLESERKIYLDKVINDESLMKETERLAHIGSFRRELASDKAEWSDELFRILGYEPGEMAPSMDEFINRIHAGDSQRVKQKIDFAIAHLESVNFEFRIITKDNAVKHLFSKLTVERNSEQKAVSIKGFTQDITQLKAAENEIKALNELLEIKVQDRTAQLHALNEELEAFNYSVSHDLRSPLRIIDGFAQILCKEMDERLTDDDRKALNVIKDSAARMNQLIDSFLSLSKLGRVAINLREINMEQQVKAVLEEIRSGNHFINTVVHVGQLPGAQGDPGLLHQVWHNLIANAFKYSCKKKEPVVDIGFANIGGKSAYFVKDNGAGFDMSKAEKLFVAFQRLHKGTEFDGTGVGLALAQRIIKKHGGEIWAEAAVDEGATFYFTLSA